MADEPERKLVFLFDENMPQRLANALRGLGENAFHVYDPEINLGSAPDEIVLEHAGRRGWFLIGKDNRILHRPHERAVLRKYDMGAFFLKQSLDTSLCSITQAVFRNWAAIKREAASQKPPFLREIRATSIAPMRRKHLGREVDEDRKRRRHNQ